MDGWRDVLCVQGMNLVEMSDMGEGNKKTGRQSMERWHLMCQFGIFYRFFVEPNGRAEKVARAREDSWLVMPSQ